MKKKGIISGKMEIDAEIEDNKKLAEATLGKLPMLEKVDISADDLYSDYYNVELQLKLKKTYDKLNSPMRIVGDYLDTNHVRLKGQTISYKEVADTLGLTEGQVYAAIQNLQAYNEYSFIFHPVRKKHPTTKFGSFKYSIDDYTGWCKENDIREKTVNRKIIVIRKSQDHMLPKFKEKIMAHKIKKIQNIKESIIQRQVRPLPQEEREEEEEENE